MKKDQGITILIFTVLLGSLAWFFTSLVSDIKTQDRAQWQQFAQSNRCLYEDLAKVRERVSYQEGYRAGYREGQGDRRGKR